MRDRYFSKAIELFGTTEIPALAEFILPDGTMLNFSYGSYQRDRDHRDVGEVWIELGEEYPGATESMILFERMGAIRYSQYGQGVNVTLNTFYWPTWRQWEAIRLAGNECEVAYDVYNRKDSRIKSEIIDFAWGNWISALQNALEEAKENE